jgi:hypothetical protein
MQENAPAHRALATQKKLAYLGFQYLDPSNLHQDIRLLQACGLRN